MVRHQGPFHLRYTERRKDAHQPIFRNECVYFHSLARVSLPAYSRSRPISSLSPFAENAADGLKDRILELSLADLQKGDDENSFRKIKLRVADIQGKNCLTTFHGMDFTSDKIRSLVRKWQTLIEANIDVKTTDGYLLRMFAIGFTKKRPNQVKKTTYAKASQIREIRKKMFEIMSREASSCDLKQVRLLFFSICPFFVGGHSLTCLFLCYYSSFRSSFPR